MKVVLLLGGAVIDSMRGGDVSLAVDYSKVIGQIIETGHRVSVVAGGGRLARELIEAAERLGASPAIMDLIGIEITRVNAMLIASALGDLAVRKIPRSYEEFMLLYESGKVVVTGGMAPGQSTDAVAAVISELTQADLMVKATGVDGVIVEGERGPLVVDRVSYEEMEEIIRRFRFYPGRYDLMDPVALRVLRRSGIKCVILNGLKPTLILRALGGEGVGTVVGD